MRGARLNPIVNPDNALGWVALALRAYVQVVQRMLKAPSREAIRLSRLCLRVTPAYTMSSLPHLEILRSVSAQIREAEIEGDVVECGTWNGGSAAVIGAALMTPSTGRRMWLFDSFEGLPAPSGSDPEDVRKHYYKGWCTGDVSKVQRILQRLGVPLSCVTIVKGWFDESFRSVDIPKIALLHIDADWHDSVRRCLEKFYDHVVLGGFVVIDDYARWDGCKRAVDAFLEARSAQVRLRPIASGGIYFQKEPLLGSGLAIRHCRNARPDPVNCSPAELS